MAFKNISYKSGLAAVSALFLPVDRSFAEGAALEGPEEIFVTARRKEESLLDIPAAVTALTAEQLGELGGSQLADISAIAPNLTIIAGSAQSNAASIYIRGIGQRDSLQTFEQAVGLYVDGVYFSRMQGSMMRLFDVERIEVLRGPQGVLYGKNTIGGAVNIITRDPFDAGGVIEAEYGSFNQIGGSLYAPFVLQEGKVAASFSARYANRDGFYTDEFTGVEYLDDNVFSGRFKLALRPDEKLDITLSADLMDIDIAQYVGFAESELGVLDVVTGPTVVRPQPDPFDGEIVASSIAPENGQSNTHWGLSGTISYDVSDTLSFKSITAYRHMNPVQWLDADGSELALADVWATWVHDQFSQELQLAVTEADWDAIIGAFYMSEKSVAVQETFLDGYLLANGVPIGFTRPGNDVQNVDSYAVFGHLNYKLSEQITASVGARWSRDEKTFYRESETTTSGIVTDVFVFEGEDAWDAFTPSFTLDYKLSGNSHIYANVARGFRSGGFNGRLFSEADAVPFAPEYVWSYEVGLKGSSGEELSYGLTLFYNDYTDYQARVAVAIDSSDPSAGFNFPTINAAKLEIYGAELELQGSIDALDYWFNAGLLSASYKEFNDDQRDRTDQEPIRAPDVTLAAGFSYILDLGNSGSVNFAADARYVSSYYTSIDNAETLKEDGYALVGAHARWSQQDGSWYAKAGVKNLFDALYQVDAFEFRTLGNIQTGFYGDPRTWYLAIGRTF